MAYEDFEDGEESWAWVGDAVESFVDAAGVVGLALFAGFGLGLTDC